MTKLIKRRLQPEQARLTAIEHNKVYHNGVPTVHISVDVDDETGRRLPRYKVWCPKCEEEQNSHSKETI